MKKKFVIDTNIILHDPYSILKFGENDIIIPAIVIEEIDTKKRQQDEIGKNARVFSRIVDSLRNQYPLELNKGVPLENGGTLRIELNHVSYERMQHHFENDKNDNRILAVALNLYTLEQEKEENDRSEVILVTNDILNGIKGSVLGVRVEKYENDRLVKDLDNVHRGYHEILVPSQIIDSLYEEEAIEFEKIKPYVTGKETIYMQDFLLLKDELGTKQSGIGRVLKTNGKMMVVTLVTNEKEEVWGIKPKNVQQRMMFELLLDPNVKLVCGVGQAGTGKTLLALAAALLQTEEEKHYKKTLVARPVVPMGKDLGFLPGDMKEKLRPWMQPIYDNLEFLFHMDDEEEETRSIEDVVQKLKLEVEALTYIRGRSIPNQFFILDEAQNISPAEAKTLISRIGEGSKIILLGDPEQIDHPYLDATNNGLTYVIERMKQESDVGVVHLKKTERSSLAERAAKLL